MEKRQRTCHGFIIILRIIQSAITQADINEYVSHYSAPGGMRDGFNYFRAFPQDAIQNINYSKTKTSDASIGIWGRIYPSIWRKCYH